MIWCYTLSLGRNLEENVLNNAKTNPFADIDPRLLSEAFRRARERAPTTRVDSDSLLTAIFAEARLGTRDMYGLVKAAEAKSRGSAA